MAWIYIPGFNVLTVSNIPLLRSFQWNSFVPITKLLAKYISICFLIYSKVLWEYKDTNTHYVFQKSCFILFKVFQTFCQIYQGETVVQ